MDSTPNRPHDLYAMPVHVPTYASRRRHERIPSNQEIEVYPANGAGADLAVGTAADVSMTGVRISLDRAVLVGDVFQLVMSSLDHTAKFGRCLRCALGEDGRYEAAFQFLLPVEYVEGDGEA